MRASSLVLPAKFFDYVAELEEQFTLTYNPVNGEEGEPREDDWEATLGNYEVFGLTPTQAFGNLMAKLFPPEEPPEEGNDDDGGVRPEAAIPGSDPQELAG